MENSYLKFEVIWKDEHMFEIDVLASNGRFKGNCQVYETSNSLLQFAMNLKGFPDGRENLIHKFGKKDSYSFFEMRFYQIGLTGIVGVQIEMEGNVPSDWRIEEKEKLIMELIVEPNAVDNFQKELVNLAKTEDGKAELIGIKKHTNNII